MRRKEQAAASRADLLAAARSCFVERGYEATTVAEILARAGMARGALYHYFPGGKREIFTAVFDEVNTEYHRRRDAHRRLRSPVARIKGGIRVFLELCTDDAFARIALVDAPRIVPGQDSPGSSLELLRVEVAEAVAAREFRKVDVELTAAALHGAARSAGEQVTASADPDAAVRAACKLVDLLVDGLRPRR